MIKLVLLRHGESVWNKENRFTGWTDVELSEKGIDEAIAAGSVLRNLGYKFDLAYTSVLKRANDTLIYVLNEIKQEDLFTKYDWRLNERHYGALQGLNKEETRLKYGDEQVHLWRRSIGTKPPLLELDDPRYPGNDPKYQYLDKEKLPLAENLLDTMARVLSWWHEEARQDLLDGKSIIVVAHGNSLRALIKYLEDITDEKIMELEIPTGNPLVYELDDDLKPITKYYLK